MKFEWNAEAYHRLSDPQFAWGVRVLARLALCGDERALDIGCGSGRLTAELRARLPRGRVVAADLSGNMARAARETLAARFPEPPEVVCADAAALPFAGVFDVIVSTATFHWVTNHPRLFRSLFDALAPGGRLHAQCGGGPNLERLHARAAALMREPPFAPHFVDWRRPWEFADSAVTAERLRSAGFEDVETGLDPAPVVFDDATVFRDFLATVVLRLHLARLADAALCDAFLDSLVEQAAADDPKYELDYWRLNLSAIKPLSPSRGRAPQ
jgi:trans-aconitate 2-methyltransferase